MIKQLISRLFCLVLLMCLFGCLKENGKHEYLFTFTFSNGEQIKTSIIIREKPKKYNDNSDKVYWRNNKDLLAIVPIDPANETRNEFNDNFLMIKLDDKTLISNTTMSFHLFDSQITGASESSLLGSLNCSGDYKRFGRKITVEEGTFSFEWYNAEDIGKQDTILTGTWSLKRD